jgi:hypothetical protein
VSEEEGGSIRSLEKNECVWTGDMGNRCSDQGG